MLLETLFTERKNNAKYNTSYPISPNQWKEFKIMKDLDFSNCPELSFYIHIPFCQNLCRFCEYQRMVLPSHELQLKYLHGVKNDIESFLTSYPTVTLKGFDIGGGTPTALDEECFGFLMNLYRDTIQRVSLSDDFEPSIEATFQTISPAKIKQIVESGIKRLSLGIQSSVKSIQKINGRVNPSLLKIKETIHWLHDLGVEKVNLDLMYGLKDQTLEDVEHDIDCINFLSPEQVTLYELRTNMITLKGELSKEFLYASYKKFYDNLIQYGYSALFGQNTFSKCTTDLGLSSYLRNRMVNFLPYKGFGLSAQSLTTEGISYNIGKQSCNLKDIVEKSNSFPSEDCYLLPPSEILSKYIAVSGYYGRFSISVANRILNSDFLELYGEEVRFCLQHGFIKIENNNVEITPKGYAYYGAVFSLFFN